MKKKAFNVILLSLFIISLFGSLTTVSAEDTIEIRLFTSPGCPYCAEAKATIIKLNQNSYNGKLNLIEIDTFTSSGFAEFKNNSFTITPSAVINGTTKLEGISQFDETSLKVLFDSILDPATVTPTQPTTPTGNGKTIRFFYEETCDYCKASKAKMYALIDEKGYDIEVVEVDVFTPTGYKEFTEAGFKIVPSAIICGTTKLEGVNQVDPDIQKAIEGCLAGTPVTNGGSVSAISLLGAFAAGFFSSLSPCLLAVISFIIAYTAGSGSKSLTILLKSIFFGLGITGTYMIMAVVFISAGATLPRYLTFYLSLVGASVVFFLGLNLINTGLNIVALPISKKSFGQRMTKKLVLSYGLAGVFLLGMIFAVINIPCAAIILPILIDEALYGTAYTATLKVLLYGVGILVPFIIIGAVGAFTKNIARDMRWNPTVRFFGWVVMGGVVIIVSFWLLIQGFNMLETVTTQYILHTILTFASIMFIVGYAYGKWKKVDKGDDGKKEVRAY